MKRTMVILVGLFLLVTVSQAWASLDQSTATVLEGAVEFPMGLVKLVGGLVWTVGEVIALPFKLIF